MAEGWERLYRDRYDRLVREAEALVLDRDLAEDLAQDAFERLMRADLKDTSRAWAWLRVVVRRRALDHWRQTARLARAAPDDEGIVPSAEAEALSGWARARVRALLASLAPRERDAIWLRHQGCSYRDIARATGIPENQVGVVLLRAMKKLRQAFEVALDKEGFPHGKTHDA